MKEFLYLFRGGEDPHEMEKQAGPEAWQQHMMKWKTWMESLAGAGKYVGGQPLAMGGSVFIIPALPITGIAFLWFGYSMWRGAEKHSEEAEMNIAPQRA